MLLALGAIAVSGMKRRRLVTDRVTDPNLKRIEKDIHYTGFENSNGCIGRMDGTNYTTGSERSVASEQGSPNGSSRSGQGRSSGGSTSTNSHGSALTEANVREHTLRTKFDELLSKIKFHKPLPFRDDPEKEEAFSRIFPNLFKKWKKGESCFFRGEKVDKPSMIR